MTVKHCPKCGRELREGEAFCPSDGAPAQDRDAPLALGAIVAKRYRVDRMLGQGGMGRVYLVHHLNLDAPLAIKVISPQQSRVDGSVERLRREARNAHLVRHPYVVAVHDLEEDGKLCFLTMDFVDGPTLDQVIEEEGKLPLDRVLPLVRCIAEGLGAIHAHRMVHRDLKPSNVILDLDDDGNEIAKLLDFGIARREQDASQALTSPEFVFGTPGFMAPEHRLGLPVDGRADVFSLGVLTLYLLSGRLPRLGVGEGMSIDQFVGELAPPSELRPIFEKVLARGTADRYPRAVDFVSALERAATGEEVAPMIARAAAMHERDALPARSPIVMRPSPTIPFRGLELQHEQPTVPAARRGVQSPPAWGWLVGAGIFVLAGAMMIPKFIRQESPAVAPVAPDTTARTRVGNSSSVVTGDSARASARRAMIPTPNGPAPSPPVGGTAPTDTSRRPVETDDGEMARRIEYLRAFPVSLWLQNVDTARVVEREAAVALAIVRDAAVRAEVRFILIQALWSQGRDRRREACREVATLLLDSTAAAMHDATRPLATSCAP